MRKFKEGDRAFLIESKLHIKEVIIKKSRGDFYVIQFADRDGGIQVRESRLYATKEEAEEQLPKKVTRYRSPYDYM